MQLEPLPDARAVARRVADRVAETLRAKPDAVLLLPAGATPVALYAELVRRVRAGTLDLGRARLFQLDELAGVAPDDRRGFRAFFDEHLCAPLGLALHGIDGARADHEAEIARHRDALAAAGGADLALLGLGRNGHVAFNEPGTRPDDAARVVALDDETRAGLRGAFGEDAPCRGLTLGLAEILGSRSVVLLVTGASKAEVLARVLRSEPDPALPASLLATHPDVTVYADAEALSDAPVPDV